MSHDTVISGSRRANAPRKRVLIPTDRIIRESCINATLHADFCRRDGLLPARRCLF